MEKTKKRGGKREGAGRPKIDVTKQVQIAFRTTEEMKMVINKRAESMGMNFSSYINWLIQRDISK